MFFIIWNYNISYNYFPYIYCLNRLGWQCYHIGDRWRTEDRKTTDATSILLPDLGAAKMEKFKTGPTVFPVWKLVRVLGRVYYRALVHFVHLLWVLSVFTLSDPAELSTLEVPGWSTRNGEKMKWKTMVTTRTKRAPSWLRSGKGGALSAAFHKKSTFILAGLVSRVSRADLRPSLPPSG